METPRPANPSLPDDPTGRGFLAGPGTPCPSGSNRLNLLLSYADWHPEPWAHRLPPLLEPLGIRSLTATTGQQATHLLQSEPVHIAIVDLSLPLDDTSTAHEAGTRVLELLSRLAQPPPTLVIKRSRTHRDDARELAAALRAGAFAVLDRPRCHNEFELLLEMLRRALTRHYQGRWPGTA